MALQGHAYLVIAISGASVGLWLVYGWVPIFFQTLPNSDGYFIMFLMSVSVICFWSSLRFIIINRRQRGAVYAVIGLSPAMLVALLVIGEYVAQLIMLYRLASR